MPFRRIWHGRKFDVDAWVENDRCEIEDALAAVLEPDSPPHWKRIVSLIVEAAENGPPENEEQCRLVDIERTNDLYEFKPRGGVSVFWFYYEKAIIICSCIVERKRSVGLQSEVDKALSIRQQYIEEKKHGETE